MEKYTLRELINNKEAQQTLLEKGFYMSSNSNGYFGGMSYPDLGLQEILMTVFESIEEYGEDEVLERMFEAGGTCLTNDSKAAKSGVKPAGNSKKYFVKSNMGAAMKFSAILKAMMSYETHQMPEKVCGEPFSADELIFSTEPVNTEWTIWDNSVDLEENAALAAWEDSDLNSFSGECDEYNPFAEELMAASSPKNYSFVTRSNGKHFIFDEDNNCFASLTSRNDWAPWNSDLSFDTVHSYEKVSCTDAEGNEHTYGWKYQLEEDGKWGWISEDFNQILAPEFDGFAFAENSEAPYLFAVRPGNLWFYLPEEKFLVDLNLWNASGFGDAGIYFKPDMHYEVDCSHLLSDYEILISAASFYDNIILTKSVVHASISTKSKTIHPSAYKAKKDIIEADGKEAFLKPFNLDTYHNLEWHEGIQVFDELNKAEENTELVCAIKKDLYWALFKGKEQLTPYLYTSIEPYRHHYHFVNEEGKDEYKDEFYIELNERGKIGLFDHKTKKYILPCDYEYCFSSYIANHHICVWKHGKNGLFSIKDGYMVLPCQYDNLFNEYDKYVRVVDQGRWGLFDIHSKQFMIPCLYDAISGVSPNHYLVRSQGKYGVISGNFTYHGGHFILSCQYDNIFEHNGILDVESNGKKGIFNIEQRKWKLPCQFDHYVLDSEGFYKVQQNGRWGVYDSNAHNFVIPCDYERIENAVIEKDEDYNVATVTFTLHKGPFKGRFEAKEGKWVEYMHEE